MLELRDIEYIVKAHRDFSRKESKAFRKFDGQTPSYTHLLWSATAILTETSLDNQLRADGSQALLYHDILKDTTVNLPDWLSEQVKTYIHHMTFVGGSKQEMSDIWIKPKEIKLFKLYDKVHNLLDGSWMEEEKRQQYEEYTGKLVRHVTKHYGELNIMKIAEGILK